MRKILFLLAVAPMCLPTLASEPGQPPDCSDWVFTEPGFQCTPWIPYRCSDDDALLCLGSGKVRSFDNEGWHYRVEEDIGHHSVPCGAGGRLYIYRFNGTTEQVFAYIDERCDGDNAEQISHRSFNIDFDPVNGRLLVYLSSECYNGCTYPAGDWVASIEGFATIFEILQTYTPTSGPISFRVPYMPEGFQHADYFDTYYGSLATVGDWSQAQPLECGYPTTAPSVGDYLTVADTLPTPGSNQGYYYVTAVTYAGETRYGRKCSNGVLSGRDPGVLPECN